MKLIERGLLLTTAVLLLWTVVQLHRQTALAANYSILVQLVQQQSQLIEAQQEALKDHPKEDDLH